MAGLNFMHAVAQAWEAGKLFHIDLNDQAIGPLRPGLPLRRGEPQGARSSSSSSSRTSATTGPRHFDAHAYRTEDYDGVKEFARGCMRTYLILKEKAARWNEDAEIQAILKEIEKPSEPIPAGGKYSASGGAGLLAHTFNRTVLAAKAAALREARSADGGSAAGREVRSGLRATGYGLRATEL